MKRDIIGFGGGKGGDQHVHYEATDSLHSISYARVLDLISEGEVLGLANGLKSVYLDGTPVQNADGTNNFQNISVDFRAGTQTQDPIPGFPSVESETSVNVELRSTAPWVHSITNTQLDAIRVTLAVQALSKTDTENGDINGYQINYQIELSTDGGAYSVVISNSFNGKTTSVYQRSARIDLPAATTGWSIRVTRLTANANTSSIADTTTIVSYTEVIDAKLRYPMSCIVGIQVDAKQFSSVPARAYDMYGRIIQVPANYDPVARTYATTGTGTSNGAWDGTFKLAWTSNPAWIFRDLVLNDRYGLGQRISASQVDKWGLYKIAQYCDQMVPNGKGGTEPRFTCNVYLQSQKEAYAVLQDLASVFRGIAYWGGNSIMTAADMPSDPVYVYTAANVIGGKFSYVGSSKKTRSTVALVSWNDMSDMGRAKVEYVEDAEGVKRYGIQQINLTAFGCTSQSQAQRVGRWALATARLETEAVSFDVGLDGAIALPGQIVRIADPSRAGRRNGGRIHSASGRDVVIDKAPTIAIGDKFTAMLPNGTSETHNVAAISGNTVTIDADWSTMPNAQSVWTVDNTDLVAPLYRIISVEDKEGLTYSITATKHEPGKFDYVENNTVIQTYSQTSIDVSKQAAPASVTVTGYTVSLQDVQKLALHVACDPVAGAIGYEGAYKRDNGNWIPIPRQFSPAIDIVDVLAGTYIAKLSAVNSIGVASVETVSSATTVSKNVNPKNAGILLTPSAPAFHVATDGTNTPASITFNASLLALTGTISFSCVGGTLTNITATSADLTYANLAGTSATVTASITVNGTTYSAPCTVSKVQDGAAGSNGAQAATAYLYQRAASSPPTDPGAGTFNFSTNTVSPSGASFAGGWLTAIPAGSLPLWMTSVSVTATAPATTAAIAAGAWANPVILAQNGSDGASGTQAAVARLYKWATSAPAAPTGTSTYTWATGANGSYSAGDGWSVAVPSNPGTPGAALYVVSVAVTAAAGATSTSVSYSGAAVQAWSQNGANGTNGTTGVQSGAAIVYQWAASIPAGPSGAATYTWSSGAFGAAPTGWSLTPGTAPSAGYTLWQARVGLTDSAANSTTAFNWTSAAITAAGVAGQTGASYVTAYCDSTTATTTTAPAATTGKTSVPAANDGGVTGTWTKTVPTSLASGHYMWQTDGIYDPSTNQVTWSIPYWSYAKFGSLSAIVANLGQITAGSIDIGTGATSWHVDASGNTWAGASTFAAAPYRVDNAGSAVFKSAIFQDASGNVILQAGSPIPLSYAPSGTLNSAISIASNGTLSGAGGGQVTIGGLGYTGALNASADITLVGTNVSISGNSVKKNGGANLTWGDSGAYSLESSTGGAFASASPSATTTSAMFGLNDDPTTDNTYTSMNYAIFLGADATYRVYENGVSQNGGASFGTYVAGDIFSVKYDNSSVYYLKNGTVFYSHATTSGLKLSWDSAFRDLNSLLNNVRFGPLSDVSAGVAANAAINDATTGLATKLANNARSVLSGGAGLAVGSLTWDATGARTGGYGVGMNALGIVGYNSSGTATFTLNASTGAVAVAGDISGSTGTFGAVTIGSSASFGQTAYDTGNGGWIQGGASPKISMRSAGGKYWRVDVANEVFEFNGATINNATISAPTVTGTGPITSTGANGTRTFALGVTPTGKAPFTYSWSIGADPQLKFSITGGGDTDSVTISCTGTNAQYTCAPRCTIFDANGQAVKYIGHIDATFGTPV